MQALSAERVIPTFLEKQHISNIDFSLSKEGMIPSLTVNDTIFLELLIKADEQLSCNTF